MMRRCLVFVLLSAALSGQCRATNIVITAFQRNGRLAWQHDATNGWFSVEWASSPTGTWSDSWSMLAEQLTDVPATGGACSVCVPCLYRVLWYTNSAPAFTSFPWSESVGTGSSSFTATFDKVLTHFPVVIGTLRVTDAYETFTDPGGSGLLTGDKGGVGSVNYQSGAITVSFFDSPPAGRSVLATYRWTSVGYKYVVESAAESIGVGTTNLTATFTAVLRHAPLMVASLSVSDGYETVTDTTGSGLLTGDKGGIGSVNYQTGAITVTLFVAPLPGRSVIATYRYPRPTN